MIVQSAYCNAAAAAARATDVIDDVILPQAMMQDITSDVEPRFAAFLSTSEIGTFVNWRLKYR